MKSLNILLIGLGTLLILSIILLFVFYQPSSFIKNINKAINNADDNWICSEYANYYVKELAKSNISTIKVLLSVDSIADSGMIYLKGHTYIIAYNEDGYCSIDGKTKHCIFYEK